MMHFAKTLKTAALAGLVGIGLVAATVQPARAERAYTHCDRDGDRCWRVVCDNDGDDCRSYLTHSSYDGRRRDRYRNWYDRQYRGYDRAYDQGYYNSGYRRWVCDWDGDDCHWTYDRYR